MCIYYSLHLFFNQLKINEDENGKIEYGKRNCKLFMLGGFIYIIIFTILYDRKVVTKNIRIDGLIYGMVAFLILDISVMGYTYKSYFGRNILNEIADNEPKFNYNENTHKYSKKDKNIRIVKQSVDKFKNYSMEELYKGKYCCVCLDEYNLDTNNIVLLPCSHTLHKECKNKLTDIECPICRKT